MAFKDIQISSGHYCLNTHNPAVFYMYMAFSYWIFTFLWINFDWFAYFLQYNELNQVDTHIPSLLDWTSPQRNHFKRLTSVTCQQASVHCFFIEILCILRPHCFSPDFYRFGMIIKNSFFYLNACLIYINICSKDKL